MNIKDLRKLKNVLEKEDKYVLLYNNKVLEQYDDISDYFFQLDTERVIDDCEKLFENVAIDLAINNIPYDQIGITSRIGLLCQKDYPEALEKVQKNSELTYNEKCQEKMKVFENHITSIDPNIVYVHFYLNPEKTGIKELNIDNKVAFSYHAVSGFVDYHKFRKAMQRLGFDVEVSVYATKNDQKFSQSIFKNKELDNYKRIADIIKNGKYVDFTRIEVIANFGRNQEIQLKRKPSTK